MTAEVIDTSEGENTLLPEPSDREIETIGGPGKEYWVFGENFANDQDPRRLERIARKVRRAPRPDLGPA